MDLKTGLSIYNRPWLIEPSAAMQMLGVWEQVRGEEGAWQYGKSIGRDEADLSPAIKRKLFAINGTVVAPESSWDMEDFEGFDGATVAVIPISGPLMKHDYCGSLGTGTLKQLVRMASETESVQSIVLLVDSPGGTVDGTEAFANEIRNSAKNTIAFISGMACSAAYWLASACNKAYAGSQTDMIGCIGTMITLRDNSKMLEKVGIVKREYYATDSSEKNKDITDAINGDGKGLIENLLDPNNDVFIASVKKGRGSKLKEEALAGKTYTSTNALEVGLIDGIKSYDEVLAEAGKTKVKQQTTPGYSVINNSKTRIMTASEIKAQHPDLYKEIVNATLTAERDRVKGWNAWRAADPEAVDKGIADGAQVTPGVISEMSAKMATKAAGAAAEGENAPKLDVAAVTVPKVKAEGDKEDTPEVSEAVKAEFAKLCGVATKK